ncbi:MAG: APC family permease [Alicyclobacillus sp.]|nr:APC family permease [Alicyclobacillus sp.]
MSREVPYDSSSAGPSDNRLKANALSLSGAIAMGIAMMAPAAGMMFVPPVVAQSAGAAVPLAYLISLIGCLFIANTIVQFSRRIPHAGSFFAYNAAGLGKVAGFLSGWLVFAGYFVFYPQNVLAAAYFASSVIQQHFGVHISWVVFAVLIVVTIWYLSYRGISSSMKTDLYFVLFEMLVISAVILFILVKGGDSGYTAQVFTASASPKGWSGIFFGMIFAVMTFMGFESSATVAEETANPQRNIPRAIWGSVIGLGIFFVICTYAMSIGFGVRHGNTFASTSTPMDYLANRYGGSWLAGFVDVAGVISAFAVSLGCNNAAVRILYAMGRDGVLPAKLGLTHRRFLTPVGAIHFIGVFAGLLSLVVGLAFGPYPNGYGMIGAFGSIPILICYILACISLIRFVHKNDRARFHWFAHAVAPVIGALVMLAPLYGSVYPIPAWPYNFILGLVILYVLIGIVLGFVLKNRSAGALDRIGQMMSTGDVKN